MKRININYMTITDISKARIITSESYEIIHEGWYITFSRKYGIYEPISVASVSNNRNMRNRNFYPKAPWLPEEISMFIDDEGIQLFQWNDPVSIVREEIYKGQTITRDEIQEIIRKHFTENYIGEAIVDEKAIPKVFKIQLTGAIIPDEKNGKIIPAWAVFYSTQADNNIYALPAVTFFDARTGNPINPFSVDP